MAGRNRRFDTRIAGRYPAHVLRAISAKLRALLLISAVFAAVLPTRAVAAATSKSGYCMQMAGDNNSCHSCLTDPNQPPKCCSTSASPIVLFLSAPIVFRVFAFSGQLIVDLPAKLSLRFDRPPAPPPRSVIA
jgi:hypothetical protein